MKATTFLFLAGCASTNAFITPTLPTSRTSSTMKMALGPLAQDMVGSDLEWPEFDPVGFTNTQNQAQIDWYRAAELKHGRVAMLASLGQIFQSFFHLPDPVFNQSGNPITALNQVYNERPLAFAQILLAIFACEALGAFQQAKPGAEPGNLGWDPLNLRADNPELWEKTQLRELKNGRLAMMAIAGMLVQEQLTGYGVIEQWNAGAINPFGDGKGAF